MHPIFPGSHIFAPDQNRAYDIHEMQGAPELDLFRREKSEAIRQIPSPVTPAFMARRLLRYPENLVERDSQGGEKILLGLVHGFPEELTPDVFIRVKEIHLSEEGFKSPRVLWEEICHCLYRGRELDSPRDDFLGLIEICTTFCATAFFVDASERDRRQLALALGDRLLPRLDSVNLQRELKNSGRAPIRQQWAEMLKRFSASSIFGTLPALACRAVNASILALR